MFLDERESGLIDEFRIWMESAVSGLLRTSDFNRQDGDDGRLLLTRWPAGRRYWYEIAIRPFLCQVRVGVMTDDVFRSEDLGRLIADSGYTLQEFVVQGFGSVGLEWADPAVEHYCEEGLRYYYSTPMEFGLIDQLGDWGFRDRMLKVLAGYGHAFFGCGE